MIAASLHVKVIGGLKMKELKIRATNLHQSAVKRCEPAPVVFILSSLIKPTLVRLWWLVL